MEDAKIKAVLGTLDQQKLWKWGEIGGWFIGSFVALLVLRGLLLRVLHRRGDGGHPYVKVFAETIGLPSVLWCLAGALSVGARYAELTPKQESAVNIWTVVFLITSVSLVIASLVSRIFALFGEKRGVQMAASGLARTLAQVLVLTTGGLILLNYLGISVTPILTVLGVGGLAVGLALQDTLSNLFAGVHILIEEPFRVGDFIRLTSGEEGTVTDIGWRTTRLLQGVNNMVVIPNNKITTTALVNFALPQKWLMTEIDIATAHHADPAVVERIAMAVARSTEGVLAAPEPVFLFDPGPLPTHLQFKLIVPIEDRLQQGIVRSRIRFALVREFTKQDVPMPLGERLIGWP
jgi:small-conductance mechanosensitive channel